TTFRVLIMAECVQRVLFHRRILAGVSTNRFLEGAASFPAAAKAFRKMSVCALRGLECLSFVLVEMLDSLRCLPERQRRFRRSIRVELHFAVTAVCRLRCSDRCS